MKVTGKVALVTGAQQGIGRAAAVALAAAGADIVVNWLDDETGAAETSRLVQATGRVAILVRANVALIPDIDVMILEAMQTFGRIDILVNNAGIFPRMPFLDLTESVWDEVHDVNLKGTAFCSQAVARRMVEGGHGGAIVNLSSQAARGSPNGVHYSASKAGIIGLTRAMALELAPSGIRVNAVAPGLIDTAQPRYGMSEEALAEAGRTLPLGRIGRPEEIADAIVYLASDRSSFMTGEVMQINGGGYMA